jgi:hypothetical protein
MIRKLDDFVSAYGQMIEGTSKEEWTQYGMDEPPY